MLNHSKSSPFDLQNKRAIENIRIDLSNKTDTEVLNSLLQGISEDVFTLSQLVANKVNNETFNTAIQSISEDVFTLSQLVANKQDKFTGVTTALTIITGVNFASETVITKTLTISNGIIESISDV
ncbi:MAG: hypothetical protein PHV52_00210 [Aliarcobacter sp.]|nr:hypothetical protein [Aliarcobacter sp.]